MKLKHQQHSYVIKSYPPLTALDAARFQNISELADLGQQLGVGDGALVRGVVAHPVEGNLLAVTILHISVQTVVAHVCLRTLHPFDLDGTLPQVKVVLHKFCRIYKKCVGFNAQLEFNVDVNLYLQV